MWSVACVIAEMIQRSSFFLKKMYFSLWESADMWSVACVIAEMIQRSCVCVCVCVNIFTHMYRVPLFKAETDIGLLTEIM